MKQIIFPLLLLSLIASSQNPSKALIPFPQEYKIKEGSYKINRETKIYFKANQNLLFEATWIRNKIVEKSGIALMMDSSGSESQRGGLQLFISDTAQWCGEEGYHLKISNDGIEIRAKTSTGIFYGMQTLVQCFPSQIKNSEIKLPAIEINDKPIFEWRGLNLDCGRHFMEKNFIKRYIDLLAMHKMNVLHWHLTEDQGWRIEIKEYPRLTEVGAWRKQSDGSTYGGFYTQEDIKEVVKYASQRHITVVPEIEMPGHSLAALAAYPNLSCTGGPFEVEKQWGVFKDIYCAGNDSVFIFLQNVLDEVIELFPSQYIHIGGDEAPKFRWEHCNKCQQRMKEEQLKDEHELQSYFIERINKYLKSKGKRLIGWDEILEGNSEKLKGVTVQSWRGFEGAQKAAESGNFAIVSPTSHCYFDYGVESINLEKVYSFNPIPAGMDKKYNSQILGGEANMWTEYAPQNTIDSKVFPRLCALAEVLWTAEDKRVWASFSERIKYHYSRMDAAGIKYGFERSPMQMKIKFDSLRNGFDCQIVPGQDGLIFDYAFFYGNVEEKFSSYQGNVFINKSGGIKVRISQENGIFLSEVKRKFVLHKGINKNFRIINPYSGQYAAGGDGALLDGLKGGNHYRDNLWQGYQGKDAEFIISFGTKEYLQEVRVGFLQSTLSWIFYPEKLEVFISMNGKKWEKVGECKSSISEKDTEMTTQDFSIHFKEKKCKYVKIKAKSIGKCPAWHPGAGENSWIFMDEIELN